MFITAGRMLGAALLFSFAVPALAIEDTPQNREQEANKYLQASTTESMVSEMVDRIADTLPADKREEFKAAMVKHLDMQKVRTARYNGLVKVFTPDELHALASIYDTPAGKSAMSKMGKLIAESTPAIMDEVQLAYAKAAAETSGKIARSSDDKPETEEPKK